jgi:hypothetical protein
MERMMKGAVFVQTNAAHNEVVAFTRGADGSLTDAGRFATGGPAMTPHISRRRDRSP